MFHYEHLELWGSNPLSTIPWDDDQKPVATCKTFKVDLNEEEYEGILTDRIITWGLSYLDRCPTSGNYVLCKCKLQKRVWLIQRDQKMTEWVGSNKTD